MNIDDFVLEENFEGKQQSLFDMPEPKETKFNPNLGRPFAEFALTDNPSPSEKEMRKKLGLPVTKLIRYMEHVAYDRWQEHNVISVHGDDGPYGTLIIKLASPCEEDGRTEVRIMNAYLREMQTPSFKRDYLEAAAKL